MVVRIVNPNNPLHDVYESHCCSLAKPFRNYKYDYAHGTMNMYFSPVFNQEGATYVGAVHNIDGAKLLKDGYVTVILDGRHQRRSVEMLRGKDGVG